MVTIDWCEKGLNPMVSRYPQLYSDIFSHSCEHAAGNPKEGNFFAFSVGPKKDVDYDTICCERCARRLGLLW